jgi:myo-inositol catabolism protein IolC
VEGVFGWHEPLDAQQVAVLAAVKGVMYAGFRQAVDTTMTKREAIIICDDEYGAGTLTHAIDHDYLTALSLDRGDDGALVRLEQNDVQETLERWRVTFAKMRVRYDPAGDLEANQRALDVVRDAFFAADSRDLLVMLDLVTPPERLVHAIQAIQDSGINPDVWVVPPVGHSDGELVSALVRRDGRDEVGCLVRGRGDARMRADLEEAATLAAYVGFSVEPDAFVDVAEAWLAPSVSFADWAAQVARRYGDWIEWFRSARVSYLTATGALLL